MNGTELVRFNEGLCRLSKILCRCVLMCNVFELSVHGCGGDRVVLRFFCLVLFSTPAYNARKSHQTIILLYGAQNPAGLPELPLAKQE